MVVFTFSVLDLEYQFCANLVQNVKNCQFKLKFGTYTNSNLQGSIVNLLFLFSTGNIFFEQTCHFKLNLVLRIIRVSRIQYWRLFFYFWLRGFFFGENLFQKIKIVCWNWNLEPRLIQISRIRWWFSIFPFLDRKYYFQIN